MKRSTYDRATITSELPLLPLLDGSILLPGGFHKVTASSESSAALVAHLLKRGTSSESLADVAAVPVLSAPTEASTTRLSLDDDAAIFDLDRLHNIGTAARVVEILRSPSDNFQLVLEGRCRVKIRDVTLTGRGSSYQNVDGMYIAKVKQLDYFRAGQHARDLAEDASKEEVKLQKQLLKGVRTIFEAAHSPRRDIGTRTLQVLKSYGPALTSDLIGSLLAQNPHQRLVLLSTIEVEKRLHIVNSALQQRLAAVGLVSTSSSSSSLKSKQGKLEKQRPSQSGGRRGGGGKEINSITDIVNTTKKNSTPPSSSSIQATRGGDSDDSEDDEDNFLDATSSSSSSSLQSNEPKALLMKLKRANPPAEVFEAAVREYRRLKRTNEQHPGYASSVAYLEILADLPWSRRSSHTERTSIPSTSSNGDDNANAASGEGVFIGPTLTAVRAILDADHYGLDKVKDRILQFVAVQSLRGWDARAPVLCLVGPPGVGKTSVARSMAAALHRPFQRISLGGVRDEAEIRGHRRTYIGALPGRVINALRRAGVSDAVLLLDEVDKTGKDARGDPAAALLEVLDPEQNAAFVDTYLSVPVDLSKVVFVATANTVAEVPAPLLDRMEVVNLSGYTAEEKLGIAKQHLIPKALAEHGISLNQLNFPTPALRVLVEGYTREAGVRQLAQRLAAICRYVAVKLVSEKQVAESSVPGLGVQQQEEEIEAKSATRESSSYQLTLLGPGSMQSIPEYSTEKANRAAFPSMKVAGEENQPRFPTSPSLPSPELSPSSSLSLPIIVTEALVEEILGPRHFRGHDAAQKVASPGAAAGLVWTAAGGAVQYIECLCVGTGHHGTPGTLTLTGQLGDVLEESAKIAVSWVRAHAGALNLPIGEQCPAHRWDVHIHLPAGGVPKDGPSAGVTLAVALVSLFTGRCVRADTALTGELTLRGLVLPVGGVKEKVLAAKAAGMRQVILPSRNLKDVEMELTEEERMGIILTPAERLDQVLRAAFDPPIGLIPAEVGYPEARL
ncbi:hypothetical protein Ndes2526B_g06066 [Nannochloris sp. 'desiccata']|nr:putative Lon protease-like protein 2, peroxisomal [Chlorella desiccata (nom. nud.)]